MSLKQKIQHIEKKIEKMGLSIYDLFEYISRSGLADEENGSKMCEYSQKLFQLQKEYISELEKKLEKEQN